MSTIDASVLPEAHDVAFFQENGYWRTRGPVIAPAQLERLRAAMDRIHRCEFETGREPIRYWKSDASQDPLAILKTDNTHWADRTLYDLATNATIGAIAARLAGAREIRLWHDQMLLKPGAGPDAHTTEGNVGWHQDWNYWQCAEPPHLLTAWVAFDDVTAENGAMQAIPGSHRWGLLSGSDGFFRGDRNAQLRHMMPTGESITPVFLPLPAGGVSFHHCLTLHGSGPNRTLRPRRSLVLHLMPEGTRYRAGSPSDNHFSAGAHREQGGKDGEPFGGDAFPVLFPPDPAGRRHTTQA